MDGMAVRSENAFEPLGVLHRRYEDILIWLCPALPIVHPGCGGHRHLNGREVSSKQLESPAQHSQCQASSCQRPQQWPTYVTVPVSIHVAIAMAQPAPHNRGQEWMMTVRLGADLSKLDSSDDLNKCNHQDKLLGDAA